ncbi:MAG: hypothetical protein JW829_03130 [Pirellulales bacterium]|nr:hypothetical protein [Pirellulales bacterium]
MFQRHLKRYLTRYVVLALILAGTLCVELRRQSRLSRRLGLEDSAWRLSYEIEGEAENAGGAFQVSLPIETSHCRIFHQELRSSNLKMNSPIILRDSVEIVAVAEQKGECNLALLFDLHLRPHATQQAIDVPVLLSALDRAKYVRDEKDTQINSPYVAETLRNIIAKQSGKHDLIDAIHEYCRIQIVVKKNGAPDDAEGTISHNSGTPLGCAQAMTALCRASDIPARVVAGFEVKPVKELSPHIWVEVFANNSWIPYDPTNGSARQLPPQYLAIHHGGNEIVTASGIDDLETEFTIARLRGVPHGINYGNRQFLDVLDLTRLPLQMHRALSLILLLPFGALVTCIFRNIIGIQTSGTFTPTLLAICFIFADWRTGLTVLIAVVLLGFATRSMLEPLKLLMLPRLSILLTLVVCCIVFGISLLDYLRLTPGVRVMLLPMVILTMIVERFYITSQEDGISVAVQHLAGSCIVGFFCYLVLRWEALANMVLICPEIHLVTVAILMLLGRYTGYQLMEHWRFRDMVEMEK